jgi:hypothetical protein
MVTSRGGNERLTIGCLEPDGTPSVTLLTVLRDRLDDEIPFSIEANGMPAGVMRLGARELLSIITMGSAQVFHSASVTGVSGVPIDQNAVLFVRYGCAAISLEPGAEPLGH